VKGKESANKAIEILHRYEIHGRYMIVREVTAEMILLVDKDCHSLVW